MNIKQFFKPTKRKIILFAILLAFYILSSFRYVCFFSGSTPNCSYIFIPQSAYLLNFNNPFFIIFDALVIYLFSCLVAWIFSKLRKKDKSLKIISEVNDRNFYWWKLSHSIVPLLHHNRNVNLWVNINISGSRNLQTLKEAKNQNW